MPTARQLVITALVAAVGGVAASLKCEELRTLAPTILSNLSVYEARSYPGAAHTKSFLIAFAHSSSCSGHDVLDAVW